MKKKNVLKSNYPYLPQLKEKPSELRQDMVSQDWVVIATGRARRPHFFKSQTRTKFSLPKSKCPFDNLKQAGNPEPIAIYKAPHGQNWFIQVLPNKFPAFSYGVCPVVKKSGPYSWLEGVGFHEVIVTKDHDRQIAKFSDEEMNLVLRAYQERYLALKNDPCTEYVLIFHNHGFEAGASIPHPHSQLVGMPVAPPDVVNSLRGSQRYLKQHKACVHCAMIKWELKFKKRIVAENDTAVAFCPFASRRAFEIRVFPKNHSSHFELISEKERLGFAQVLRKALKSLFGGLNDPAYNFFIHTTPTKQKDRHYHWHLEILPVTSTWGGVEFGTGIEISTITPEEAAKYLRKF
ncbi:DUF4931 domain-containing protein [Candidatus Parcubacteria bacterium]|nr:MAG: DUF4931 domain-containing protein [Candidatus Parcubacteria bacterium]